MSRDDPNLQLDSLSLFLKIEVDGNEKDDFDDEVNDVDDEDDDDDDEF